jgi:diguanylate cyclase (GGDEF)-like protein
MRHSYAAKLLLIVIGLVVTVQLTTYFAARSIIRDTEIDSARTMLTLGGDIFTELLFNRGSLLQQSTVVLTNDFGFREAIASDDAATIRSALLNHTERVGADYATVMTQSGLSVNINGIGANAEPSFLSNTDNAPLQIRMINGLPYELVVTQVFAPGPIGAASMGFALNNSLAEEMKQLTGLEVSFVSLGNQGPNYYASTLGADQAALLPNMISQQPNSSDEPEILVLGNAEMLTLRWPLNDSAEPVYAVLQRPMNQVLASYNALSMNLLWLNVGGIFIAVVVAVFLAGDVTRPIRILANAARRISGGDYSSNVLASGTDEFGELAKAFNVMQSAIGEREQRILQQSRQDPLTGLGNRSIARTAMLSAVRYAQSQEGQCAALTIDLQRFKEVNDVFGHQAGDSLLQIIALRLLGNVKDTDSVIRLGADVFLVVLRDVDTHIALKIARRVCLALQQTVELQDLNLSVSAHVGVATYPEHGRESEELMRRSDIAMQAAKETGTQINLYQTGTDESHLRRLGLLRDLKLALASNGFHMAYQPKAALLDRHYIGAEALIRWEHPELGNVNPEEFIALAESAGYINQITRWVFSETIKQLGLWHTNGVNVHLSVNISALDLLDAELPRYLADLLSQYEVPPSYLCLELTESSIMKDEQQSLSMLNRLKGMGLRLSVDDFGTGFSSLSQLKRLPVDELKIDKSFVLNLSDNDDDAVIVRSTIELGHNMGLSVVAEGVENDASLGLLGQYGCDLIQGFFLGKPMSPDSLTTWAGQRRETAPI